MICSPNSPSGLLALTSTLMTNLSADADPNSDIELLGIALNADLHIGNFLMMRLEEDDGEEDLASMEEGGEGDDTATDNEEEAYQHDFLAHLSQMEDDGDEEDEFELLHGAFGGELIANMNIGNFLMHFFPETQNEEAGEEEENGLFEVSNAPQREPLEHYGEVDQEFHPEYTRANGQTRIEVLDIMSQHAFAALVTSAESEHYATRMPHSTISMIDGRRG